MPDPWSLPEKLSGQLRYWLAPKLHALSLAPAPTRTLLHKLWPLRSQPRLAQLPLSRVKCQLCSPFVCWSPHCKITRLLSGGILREREVEMYLSKLCRDRYSMNAMVLLPCHPFLLDRKFRLFYFQTLNSQLPPFGHSVSYPNCLHPSTCISRDLSLVLCTWEYIPTPTISYLGSYRTEYNG